MIDIKSEVKLTGDPYAGFYSCGLTMLGGGSMGRFHEEAKNDSETILSTDDGIVLKTTYTKDSESDAMHVQTSILNGSDHDITMEMLTSFVLPGIKADKIHRFLSFWSAEGKHKVDTIEDLNMEYSWNHMAFRLEKFGNIGSMPVRKYFPFLAVEDSETGHFTAVQLYSPSSWQMEIVVQHTEHLTLAGGIADRDFGSWLKVLRPGELFLAPKAVVAEGDSLLDVCDKLVKAQHPHVSPVDDHMGIAFNEYCTTWGNPTTDNIKRIADFLEGKGIQYLVMDSGWYSKCGYWWDYIGDWSINRERFPNGLKEVADYIRAKGMIPGIWFEFETVAHGAGDLFTNPAHLVKKDGVPLSVADRRYLDMEDPWVIDHLTHDVIGTLRDNGYGYIKVDYNDTIGSGCDGCESLGEGLRRKVLASQEFFRKMTRELPDLVIENCASGGHRLEPSMMELASQASFSDAHEIPSLPLIAANCQRLIRPDQCQIWSVMRAADDDARIFYSLCATFLGRMGLSGDIYDLSAHQWALIDDGMDFYREVSDIIKYGKTTILEASAKSYQKPTGNQLVVRELGDRKLAIFHRFAGSVSLSEYMDSLGLDTAVLPIDSALRTFGAADCDFSAVAMLL